MDRNQDFSVLLVDDNPVSLGIGRTWLMEQGYAVVTARTAECALLLLSVCAFDLLVSNGTAGYDGKPESFVVAAQAASRGVATRTLFVPGETAGRINCGQAQSTLPGKRIDRTEFQRAIGDALAVAA